MILNKLHKQRLVSGDYYFDLSAMVLYYKYTPLKLTKSEYDIRMHVTNPNIDKYFWNLELVILLIGDMRVTTFLSV